MTKRELEARVAALERERDELRALILDGECTCDVGSPYAARNQSRTVLRRCARCELELRMLRRSA